MTKKNKPTIDEIENSIYGDGGLYQRVVEKMIEIGTEKTMKLTGFKSRQSVDLFKRQCLNPDGFDYQPKANRIIELGKMIGVD